jgi:His-Xaa-Ser system protein HxsD
MKQVDHDAIIVLDDGSLSITFDLEIYSAAAVKKAVYKFAADCAAFLSKKEPNKLIARLSFSDDTNTSTKQAIARAFCNEVIDQDLREQIMRETEGTRNLILAQAFSKTSLLTEE